MFCKMRVVECDYELVEIAWYVVLIAPTDLDVKNGDVGKIK